MLSFPFGSLRWLKVAAVPVLTADSCKVQLNAMQKQHQVELNILQREHQLAVSRLCAAVPEDTLCKAPPAPAFSFNPLGAGSALPISTTTTIPRSVHTYIVHHISYSLGMRGGVGGDGSLIPLDTVDGYKGRRS
jgi:hypothetical protein